MCLNPLYLCPKTACIPRVLSEHAEREGRKEIKFILRVSPVPSPPAPIGSCPAGRAGALGPRGTVGKDLGLKSPRSKPASEPITMLRVSLSPPSF